MRKQPRPDAYRDAAAYYTMRADPRTVADDGSVADYCIRVERHFISDFRAASNARRRVDRRRAVLRGIKSRKELQQRDLRLGDNHSRWHPARDVGKLGSHERNTGARIGERRRVTSISEESDLIRCRAPERRNAAYLGQLLTAKLSSDKVRNGTSGERARTLTAW